MATREQLLEVITEYEAASPADLKRIVHLHEEQGGSLAELLLQEDLVGEEDLFFLMSRRLAVPAIPAERLRYLTLSPEIRRRVPRSLARECVLVPVDLDMVHGRLSVAMFDPTDQTALDKLRRISRVTEIRAYLARRSAILAAVDSVYSDADDDLTDQDRDELPLLGSGVPEGGDAAQTAAHDEASLASKVELDPSLALEIQAFKGSGYVPHPVEDVHGDRPVPEPAQDAEEDPAAEPERVEVRLHGRELEGPSLIHEPAAVAEEELTQPFMLLPEDEEDVTGETSLLPDADDDAPERQGLEEERLEHEVTQVRHVLRDGDEGDTGVAQPEQLELLGELLSSVGVLVSMLEERIDPSGSGDRDHGRLSRLVARELGLDELAVSRVALAAHLYGLDLTLKREVGTYSPMDVADVFGESAGVPGGLGPSLRSLGARALGLQDPVEAADNLGVRLIRLVSDFLELRAEADEGESDMDTLVQLLRTGGGEPLLVDALARAVHLDETPPLRVGALGPREQRE